MLPYAVITMTGRSGSSSFGRAQHAKSVAFGQLEVGQHEGGACLLHGANRLALVPRLDDSMAVAFDAPA